MKVGVEVEVAVVVVGIGGDRWGILFGVEFNNLFCF